MTCNGCSGAIDRVLKKNIIEREYFSPLSAVADRRAEQFVEADLGYGFVLP